MTARIQAPPPLVWRQVVVDALKEDLGRAGDLTTDSIVPDDLRAVGRLAARREGRVAGVEPALEAFRVLDPACETEVVVGDGEDVGAGATIAVVRGAARPMLTAERVALNLLGRLCGIATTTRDVVRSLEGSGARVVCTRKTTPLLRALEKHAVRCGGGANHRFGLDDAVLIKDNHLVLAGGVDEAVRRARERVGHLVRIELEVDSLEQLDRALALGVDAVLLDNFTLEALREAVSRTAGRATLEASGGLTPETAPAVAATGVDILSLGWLTHSVRALDVGLDVDLEGG